MEILEVNNTNYTVYSHQRKEHLPSLLMLHGFMGDHRAFEHLLEPLSSFCNPVTLDLLGHGASSRPGEPKKYAEKQQLRDMLALIQYLNLSPLFLHGYSMGGRLALKIALARPELFEGLILESTHCGIMDENARDERRQTDEARAREIEQDFEAFLRRWETLDLFKGPLESSTALTQKYHRMQSEQSPAALAASLRGFGTGSMPPVCGQLEDLDRRVLLLAGSADAKYQRLNRKLVNQFPNAVFTSIEAGHRVHLDNPSEFTENIESFIYGRD